MTNKTKHTTAAELLAARPVWAKAVIVAELHRDTSDGMTDYFAHETARAIVLAWSRHERDLFSEMRKAADLFEATAHLGTGKGDVRVRVVLANDCVTGGTAYWKGTQSPWHRDDQGGSTGQEFATREAAQAWIAQAPPLVEMHDAADTANGARFEYQIVETQIEHREKWSMGHGYYLKRGHTHDSGWAVQKHALGWLQMRADQVIEEIITAAREQPMSLATSAPSVITINAEKRGIELRFPEKPSDEIRARLKAHRWRWSRFAECWYAPDSPQARAFAESLVAELGFTEGPA
jgi:hypothetical protein